MLDRVTIGRRPWLALVALCLLLWLPGFFTIPPTDRDESRFAQATKQMLETGNYVQIRNGTVARNQKPIGIYWLQVPFAAAARALSLARANPIWPYRIPSLLGALASVLATYGFGRRLVGLRAALLGAAFLAASLVLTVEAHTAKTDAALLAAITLAMGVLSRAWLEPGTLRARHAMLFWIALGIAILIKGPIAPMVCALAALWLAIADRKRGPPSWLRALRPQFGLPLTLVIVLPWFVAIGLATHGRFFAESLGGDLAGKLAASDDAHAAIMGYHLALLPLLMFGGGGAALCAIPSVWQNRRRPEVRLLIAWVVPSWLAFELVATKLPHYTLPLYPAVALLAASWMLAPPTKTSAWTHCINALTVLLSALIGIAATAAPFVTQPGIGPPDLLGLPILVLSIALVWLLSLAWPDPRRMSLLALGAAPLLNIWLFGFELPLLPSLWIAPRVQTVLASRTPANPMLGALGYAEPSLMFLCGTNIRLFIDANAAADALISAPGGAELVDSRQMPGLADALKKRGKAIAPFATIEGYNYSRGKRIALTLVTTAQAIPPGSADQRIK